MEVSRYFIQTLGCKANLVDSQLLESELQKKGWAPSQEIDHPDIRLYVVNSCTVTDEADRQSLRVAKKLSKLNPHARVLYTGCSAEASPEKAMQTAGIDYVVGNRDKPGLVRLALEAIKSQMHEPKKQAQILGNVLGYEELLSQHPVDREWPLPEELCVLPEHLNHKRTRSFLKIQEGCDSFCTFCIIPYGRGPSRSLSMDEVVENAIHLIENGTKEIILTGTNLGDYGRDWAEVPQIETLCLTLMEKTSLQRLRLSSLDPSEITDELISIAAKWAPRFCPHFHVSLQSPHSKVLRLMKRGYGQSVVEHCLLEISKMGERSGFQPYVGMDVIVGFPGESEKDFEESVRTLKSLPWSRLHVFPYSERSGTPATRLPNSVPHFERKRRAKILSDLSLERLTQHYQKALERLKNSSGGVLKNILLESRVKGPDGTYDWILGHSIEYLRVWIPLQARDPEALRNTFTEAKVESFQMDAAQGEVTFIAQ